MKKTVLSLTLLAACCLHAGASKPVITREHKARAEELVSRMTLEQKCRLISGLRDERNTLGGCPELGIPPVFMSDGPQGINNHHKLPATYYPCGVSLAAAFDREAARGVGDGLGLDARARGVGFFLAPGVNIYRAALCGRNFEYYGEDPYLAGETASAYIQGVQSHQVIATVKHFAANNQEWDRFVTTSNVDERTLHEIYFPAFRKAVQEAGVGAVMTACGRLNAVHCSESPYLNQRTLREDWGFEGATMCDWQTIYSTLNGIQGGVDIEMPNPFTHDWERVRRLIENGVLQEEEIDEKCLHVLQTLFAFGLTDRPLKDSSLPLDNPYCHRKAYEAAAGGPVLVKNTGILPCRKGDILMTGPYADRFIMGGGSGRVKAFDDAYVTTYKGLQTLWRKGQVTCSESPTDEEIRNAPLLVAEVGLGQTVEKENQDHAFALPGAQDSLLRRLTALSDKVVVIIHSGCEVDMRGWGDKAAAILYAWYGGEHTGTVLAQILTGDLSPSGRLPFTMWGSFENNPASDTYHADRFISYMKRPRFEQNPHVDYKEGVFIGYRGIERFGRTPLYPFGYGLTYSTFSYSDLAVTPAGDGFDVTFTLKNRGKREAAEVAQVYVAPVSPSLPRPVRELKGFAKVRLPKGGAGTVTVHLPHSAFEHFDVRTHSWVADKGEYRIQVGENEQSILLESGIIL